MVKAPGIDFRGFFKIFILPFYPVCFWVEKGSDAPVEKNDIQT